MIVGQSGTLPERVKRGRFSSEERELVAQLVDEGLSAKQIALRLNRLPASVNGQIALQSLRPPANRAFCYVRKGVTVRSFSAEEDAYITALRVQSFNMTKIAELCSKRFGYARKHHTINMRLRQLAAREDA